MLDFPRHRPTWAPSFNLQLILLCLVTLLGTAWAADPKTVEYTDDQGNSVLLLDDRKPALYTKNFGDCLGSSAINVTRFDAAYYQDNMTVAFHLQGNTAVANESLMLYIGVFAYGEARFDLTFNPCNAQIFSLCPMNRSVPIEAGGIIPVSQNDVSGIPSIALSIPDFEGQAILRIFSNATQSEIGCYSAIITNGATFSHPSAVGSILGIFTFIAVIASFATAIYGDHIPTTRTHYAHSLSIFVVFSVLHHIFYTGALSMNWPSVLPAFWSNFAWSAGMIYTEKMQNSINKLIGSNKGNTTMVGAAGSGSRADGLGGGYDIADIYKRSYDALFKRDSNSLGNHLGMLQTRSVERSLAKRVNNGVSDASDGFTWYGQPVKPGLPLPGNFSGFAGTLSEESIPASNAFLTGFLWLLILTVLMAASVIAVKWILEALVKYRKIHEDRLTYFRSHWKGFTTLAVLRTCFIAFFMMMFLTLFQLTYRGSAGVIAIAVIIFLVFFVGMFGVAAYACFYRLRFGRYETQPDRLHMLKSRGLVPRFGYGSEQSEKSDPYPSMASVPLWKIRYVSEDPQRQDVHQDEDYIKRFGWLASRFRRTKWWFFAAWLFYEFIRACFYGGAAGHPMTQVFGLLIVEIIGLVAIIMAKPFEGSRLNTLMVYILGFSKVATVALSAAFDLSFNLQRITTTAIGIVIIVIQGILTILLMIAILVGAISSYMSVMRNRSDEDFRPRKWQPYRQRYFAHLEKKATDLPPPPPPPPPPAPEKPKEPYFQVSSVRRVAKIEDEDEDYIGDYNSAADPTSNRASIIALGGGPVTGRSRANSMKSQYSYSNNIPFGAKVHRASWSSKDIAMQLGNWHDNGPPPGSRRSSGMMLASRTSLPLNAQDSNGSLRESSQQHHQRIRSQTFAGGATTPTRRPGTPQRVMTPLADLQSQRQNPPAGMLVKGMNDGSTGGSRLGKARETDGYSRSGNYGDHAR